MSEKHLTDDVLLILASDRCSDEIKEAVSAHLNECESCRVRLKDTRRVHSAWAHILDRGLLQEKRTVATPKFAVTPEGSSFPWKPVFGILGVCITILLFLFNSRAVPAANASSILTSAVQNEQRLGLRSAFRLNVAGEPCSRGAESTEVTGVKLSASCAAGVSLIRKSAWANRNPLSAQVFASWRDSLPKKKDTVTKESDSLKVKTVAPSGILREASLTMRTADYHPVSLDLVFDNQQEVIFTEDIPSHAVDVASALPTTAHPTVAAPEPIDPVDGSEVDAWAILGQLHADTGWEATVVRENEGLEVKARVASPTREQELRDALQQQPAVKLDIHESAQSTDVEPFLAQRRLTGDSPPLAHDWLEQQFPDVEERNRFSNGALELSKVVLGRSFYLEQLRRSRSRMAPSASAQELSGLIAHEVALLAEAQAALATAVRPLLGQPKRPATKPLTYAEAGKLDVALGALLATSSQDDLGYEKEIETVRGLL